MEADLEALCSMLTARRALIKQRDVLVAVRTEPAVLSVGPGDCIVELSQDMALRILNQKIKQLDDDLVSGRADIAAACRAIT